MLKTEDIEPVVSKLVDLWMESDKLEKRAQTADIIDQKNAIYAEIKTSVVALVGRFLSDIGRTADCFEELLREMKARRQ